MNRQQIRQENRHFANTPGVSNNNRSFGFLPAFRDDETGQIELAKFADGRLAPVHVINGLPLEWALEHDSEGSIVAVKESVVAGFCKDGRFYTRDEAVIACQSASASPELK